MCMSELHSKCIQIHAVWIIFSFLVRTHNISMWLDTNSFQYRLRRIRNKRAICYLSHSLMFFMASYPDEENNIHRFHLTYSGHSPIHSPSIAKLRQNNISIFQLDSMFQMCIFVVVECANNHHQIKLFRLCQYPIVASLSILNIFEDSTSQMSGAVYRCFTFQWSVTQTTSLYRSHWPTNAVCFWDQKPTSRRFATHSNSQNNTI